MDEKAGKVKIEGGAELDYALEGGRITLTFPGNSLIMVYESEAAEEGKSKGDFASFGKKGEEQARHGVYKRLPRRLARHGRIL